MKLVHVVLYSFLAVGFLVIGVLVLADAITPDPRAVAFLACVAMANVCAIKAERGKS